MAAQTAAILGGQPPAPMGAAQMSTAQMGAAQMGSGARTFLSPAPGNSAIIQSLASPLVAANGQPIMSQGLMPGQSSIGQQGILAAQSSMLQQTLMASKLRQTPSPIMTMGNARCVATE